MGLSETLRDDNVQTCPDSVILREPENPFSRGIPNTNYACRISEHYSIRGLFDKPLSEVRKWYHVNCRQGSLLNNLRHTRPNYQLAAKSLSRTKG